MTQRSDPPGLSPALAAALWGSDRNTLASIIRDEQARISQELKDLEQREAEIQRLRADLGYEARVLEDLLAKRPAGVDDSPDPATTARGRKSAPETGAGRKGNSAKASSGSGGHGMSSSYLHPADRARRREQVMEAVVRYARAHGPEFSARDIVPFLRDQNIDLMVKENRASTAVSNLIYHSGDKRFSLLKQGLFRFNEAESVEPGKRGRR